jgi:hypothetical protein
MDVTANDVEAGLERQERQVLEQRWWFAWRGCGDIAERWAAAAGVEGTGSRCAGK